MHRVEVHHGIRFIIAIYQRLRLWDVEDKNVYNKRVKVFVFLFFASFSVSCAVEALRSNDKDEPVFLVAETIALSVQVLRLTYIIWSKSEIVNINRKMREDATNYYSLSLNLEFTFQVYT